MDIWHFNKGKDGKPFKLPLPLHTRADLPLMEELQKFLQGQIGAAANSILFPDIVVPAGGLLSSDPPTIMPQRMKYGRFSRLLREVTETVWSHQGFFTLCNP